MRWKSLRMLGIVAFALVGMTVAQAEPVELHSTQFPERRPVRLSFLATFIAPAAEVAAEVNYRRGQARIEMSFDGMKPAILFGGDITCFVVWAVTRDGQVENLGELLTRRRSGRVTFSTGKKNFALLVTAESYYLVGQPSELVVFFNTAVEAISTVSAPFAFDGFLPAPRHSMDAIAHIKWDSNVPLDLLQARKAHELATRNDAGSHARQAYEEAGAALKSANEIALSAPKSRELLDVARRAVALSNEALNISLHRIEALELERQLAERRAETAALERRATEAEEATEAAQRLAAEVRAEAERTMAETAALREERSRLESTMVALRQEKTALQGESERLSREKGDLERESAGLLRDKSALEVEAQRLRDEKAALEAASTQLRTERDDLEIAAAEMRRQRDDLETVARGMQAERDELNGRLQSALSHVADTQDTARGLVINLPDILFDVNEATLKSGTQIVLAKLAGILLIMPDRGAAIEGHTDSTGSAEHNLDLSQRRARAVLNFLQLQGLAAERLGATGYGMQRPVADNALDEGRRRNRRVEIVISDPREAVAANEASPGDGPSKHGS